jgi:hypothetical protein
MRGRAWSGFPALAVVVLMSARAEPAGAPQPSMSSVIARMGDYISEFQSRMATVVADEQYRQILQPHPAGSVLTQGHKTRSLRSEYALVRTTRGDEWVGFRDTFEVDGNRVRDHDDRLEQLVASGALAEASRVANESARFNLGTEFIVRNINVPTFVLQLLQRANRERFAFRKAGEETIAGTHTWRIEYRERERPTIVRTPDRHDQPSSGAVWVDAGTGEIWRTMVEWRANRKRVLGRVTVTYGRVPGVDVMVPVAMTERYEPENGATLEGDATYSNFRQFRTDARVVFP